MAIGSGSGNFVVIGGSGRGWRLAKETEARRLSILRNQTAMMTFWETRSMINGPCGSH